jgi:ABC-type bacteriocin/lantibiotic exporter with double-glycine peptidase domain
VVTIVRQRAEGDCGIAALAMVVGLAYEDTYIEVAKVDPRWRGKRGLYNRELVVVAQRLGLELQPTRRFDLDHDDGVLRIRVNGHTSPLHEHGHFVALIDGEVGCPHLAQRLPVRDYLARVDARACTLLKVMA